MSSLGDNFLGFENSLRSASAISRPIRWQFEFPRRSGKLLNLCLHSGAFQVPPNVGTSALNITELCNEAVKKTLSATFYSRGAAERLSLDRPEPGRWHLRLLAPWQRWPKILKECAPAMGLR